MATEPVANPTTDTTMAVISEAKLSEDGTNPSASHKMQPWIEIAQDSEGYHWQLWAGNGREMCRNAIAYDSLKHCLQAVKAIGALWQQVHVIAVCQQ